MDGVNASLTMNYNSLLTTLSSSLSVAHPILWLHGGYHNLFGSISDYFNLWISSTSQVSMELNSTSNNISNLALQQLLVGESASLHFLSKVTTLSVSNITIADQGQVIGKQLNLTVTDSLTIQSNAVLSCQGGGYSNNEAITATRGPGGGLDHRLGASGGAHGGRGGPSKVDATANAYGDTIHPIQRGSAGGRGFYTSSINSTGGNGGGVIIVNAQSVYLEGTISSNGDDGVAGGGGGAGGSIAIYSNYLNGSNGCLSATGGDGGFAGGLIAGGGGAGGRIALHVNFFTFNGSFDVQGGLLVPTYDQLQAEQAGSGTIYITIKSSPVILTAVITSNSKISHYTASLLERTSSSLSSIVNTNYSTYGYNNNFTTSHSYRGAYVFNNGHDLIQSSSTSACNVDYHVLGSAPLVLAGTSYCLGEMIGSAPLVLSSGAQIDIYGKLIISGGGQSMSQSHFHTSASGILVFTHLPYELMDGSLLDGTGNIWVQDGGDLRFPAFLGQNTAPISCGEDGCNVYIAIDTSISFYQFYLEGGSLYTQGNSSLIQIQGQASVINDGEIIGPGVVKVMEGAKLSIAPRAWWVSSTPSMTPTVSPSSINPTLSPSLAARSSGGGHGGLGGIGMVELEELPSFPIFSDDLSYGHYYHARTWGYPGGQWSVSTIDNTAGGGAVFFKTPYLHIDGIVSCNGATPIDSLGGGGGGGSIHIEASSLTGQGTIEALGGDGGQTTSFSNGQGGGGGGGRISMFLSDTNTFSGIISSAGGHGFLSGSADYTIAANTRYNYSYINGRVSTLIALNVTYHMNITSTGWLHSDEEGYPGSSSFYASTNNNNNNNRTCSNLLHGIGCGSFGAQGGGGGAYGGSGGDGINVLGGVNHGNIDYPLLFGSGGGGSFPNEQGGSGGGIVSIACPNIHLIGKISANGGSGSGGGAGGGSGGSILLFVEHLLGNGTIEANGGDGLFGAYFGGSGSGGRGDDYLNDRVLLFCDYLTIDSTSSLTASGQGFPGLGRGQSVSIARQSPHGIGQAAGNITYGDGGWHAGRGGGFYTTAYQPWGNAFYPITLGAAGGSTFQANGNAGGGAIHLIIQREFKLDGSLSVDGSSCQEASVISASSGGGAGGSIWIDLLDNAYLTGSGSITARGGDGCHAGGGGGSGGRIAIYGGSSNLVIKTLHDMRLDNNQHYHLVEQSI
eukprot:scaffold659_cov192-Ochromonas_danica.AAC.17